MGVPCLQPFQTKVMSFGHSACFATHQQAFRQYLGESNLLFLPRRFAGTPERLRFSTRFVSFFVPTKQRKHTV